MWGRKDAGTAGVCLKGQICFSCWLWVCLFLPVFQRGSSRRMTHIDFWKSLNPTAAVKNKISAFRHHKRRGMIPKMWAWVLPGSVDSWSWRSFWVGSGRNLIVSHLSEIAAPIICFSLTVIDTFLFLRLRLNNSRSYKKAKCVFKGVHFAMTPKERLKLSLVSTACNAACLKFWKVSKNPSISPRMMLATAATSLPCAPCLMEPD